MANPLYELLVPYLDRNNASQCPPPPATNATTSRYLSRLSTLSLSSLNSTELQSLSQSSHSNLVSLQALANRSHKAFIASADNLSSLQASIPRFAKETTKLQDAIPKLDEEVVCFSSRYSRIGENQILDRRRKAMQLARNVDRLSDILELPVLLSTVVSSSSVNAGAAGNAAASTNYSSALDLFAHIKRLHTLYPDSPLVRDIAQQAEDAMRDMTSNLIASLRVQNIRLAAALRTVSWLRRVAPELERPAGQGMGSVNSEGAFGALFLVCRLANLLKMLDALEPLRELADQETNKRIQQNGEQGDLRNGTKNLWSNGQQTERFLKRYIEIFREQSFAIVSLYKNIFAPAPSESDLATASIPGLDLRKLSIEGEEPDQRKRGLLDCSLSRLPPALATFPMHLAQLLMETLKAYLPNVKDKGSRESLLTQVLYCAASLGRLGGDFSMILSFLDEDEAEGFNQAADAVPEWEKVMKKHRVLAEWLDSLTAGRTEGDGKDVHRQATSSQH
ncbi:hypothetical protein PRK78_000466 [Emydomyces testavorans]|uniref:Conserved oligomeric Golgi complex subunit 8 n=1 Tax=Emydomyces testavorans TaxID=2070801 RepID=A0AAF0DB48_9EURO|nr:hypothetical protein PRK78_000466 [Emydomyces testavorans]